MWTLEVLNLELEKVVERRYSTATAITDAMLKADTHYKGKGEVMILQMKNEKGHLIATMVTKKE